MHWPTRLPAPGHLVTVGGSPARQRLWQSANGLAWTGAPLPAAATDDTAWHLGLVASSGTTAVLADNIAGQPYVLVRHSGTWYQPSQEGGFGYPLATATPTSLVSDNGTLVMSVELAQPGARLGEGTSSVTVLVTSNGRSWRTASKNAFDDSTVNQLLPVPTGLLAVGAAPLPVHATGSASWTGAFASLSPNEGVTWPNEPISPETLGGPGSATSAQAASDAGVADATSAAGTDLVRTTGLAGAQVEAGAGTRGGAGAGAGTPGSGGGSATSPSVNEPLAATAAGRLGDSEFVVGQAGPQAVGWFSPDGNAWEAPQPLDTSPQLGTEQPRATCWTGNSAVVVGSVTTTGPGSLPAAWVSSDGSSWTSSTFDRLPRRDRPPLSTAACLRVTVSLPTAGQREAASRTTCRLDIERRDRMAAVKGLFRRATPPSSRRRWRAWTASPSARRPGLA